MKWIFCSLAAVVLSACQGPFSPQINPVDKNQIEPSLVGKSPSPGLNQGNQALNAGAQPSGNVSVRGPSASVLPGSGSLPSASPLQQSTLQPSVTPSSSPSPQVSPTPFFQNGIYFLDGNSNNLHPDNLAFPTPDPSIPQMRRISVWVTDENKQVLEGATLQAKQLNTQKEVSPVLVKEGVFQVESLLCGEKYELSAFKEGYSLSKMLISPHCGVAGFGDENNFYFGPGYWDSGGQTDTRTKGGISEALTQKPKIWSTVPAFQALNVSRNSPIQLKFSRPMNTSSVQNHFQIRAYFPSNIKLRADISQAPFTWSGVSAAPISFIPYGDQKYYEWYARGTLVLDQRAFNFAWNEHKDEVAISFKPGYQLPSLPPENKVFMDYVMIFGGPIESADGHLRALDFFDRDYYYWTHAIPFDVLEDTQAPKLLAIQGANDLALTYSESMSLSTASFAVAGGMGDRLGTPGAELSAPAEYPQHQGNATARKVAANYVFKATPFGSVVPRLQRSWKALGGIVVYDGQDPERKTVLLKAPFNSQSSVSFYPAYGFAATQAVAADIATDTADNGAWLLRFRTVQRDGSLSQVFETPDLEGAEALDATSFAQRCQSALNTFGKGAWIVEASQDKKSLMISYSDSTGESIGWRLESLVKQGDDNLPVAIATSATVWSANTAFSWFQSGESVQIEAAATITDPAGNPLDSTARLLSFLLP
ncbi:MAG: Ig-like domain-containing protein [Candidatus Sericytochromatia bacterium]|nr:Ig-like domain-containing protein [Candidatus Sericytochromatia bacterium]